MAHDPRPLGGAAADDDRALRASGTLPRERNTEKAEGPQDPPAGRIQYPDGWGRLGRCHRHNLRWPLCPTKTRCMICRVLSRAGWGLIHLSIWISKRVPK